MSYPLLIFFYHYQPARSLTCKRDFTEVAKSIVYQLKDNINIKGPTTIEAI